MTQLNQVYKCNVCGNIVKVGSVAHPMEEAHCHYLLQYSRFMAKSVVDKSV